MYRLRFILFLIISSMIFLTLPAVNLMMRSTSGVTPLFPTDTVALWSLDQVEGNVAYTLIKCCGISLSPERAQVGQNDFLFLGDTYDNVMSKAVGEWSPQPGQVQDWIGRINQLKSYVKDQGAIFEIAIAPNKHSIYPEYLPEKLQPADSTVTDTVIQTAHDQELKILDLRPALHEAKAKSPIYYQTDTHWNRRGAAVAYQAWLDFINETNDTDLHSVELALLPARSPAGDLSKFLKIADLLGAEHEVDFTYGIKEKVTCLKNTDLNTGETTDCVQPDTSFVSVMTPGLWTTHTPNAPNEQTVLMLCDSFCSAHSTLFNTSFQTVHRAHWKKLRGQQLRNYIADLAPDMVLVQIVERDLLSPLIGIDEP